MKKVFFTILCFFAILNVYSIDQNTSNMSFSVSPLSFLTLISSGNDDEYGNQAFPYISFSLNFPKRNVEKDIFFLISGNDFSIGLETRNFRNYSFDGFFFGSFISLDYQKRKIVENAVQVDFFSSYKTDFFSVLCLKLGSEMGFRLKLGEIGVSPKIAFCLPICVPIGLDKYAEKYSSNYWNYYFATIIMNICVVGLKIDF